MQKDIDRFKEMNPICSSEKHCNRSLYMFPWSPLFPLAVHRYGCSINKRWGKRANSNIIRLFLKVLYRIGQFLSVVMRKIEIEEDAQIAKGVFISPIGGIILGANSVGRCCTIHHNVTIGFGFGRGRKLQSPDIGENVWVGPGAIIYGNIKVGDGAVVGPDTVVNKNVPPHCIISGNPARVIQKDFNNAILHKTNSPHIIADII
jgi:serine O-acetyltransferase